MHVVLLEPEIPPNTGNIARLCAATQSVLHLIEPLGFEINDRRLQRAGMDYWNHVQWKKWPNWSDFHRSQPSGSIMWFVESDGPLRYTDIEYGPNDYLIFGRESAGIPQALLEQHPDHWLRIPMFNKDARSLNLSNSVAIVLYQALRTQDFTGEV